MVSPRLTETFDAGCPSLCVLCKGWDSTKVVPWESATYTSTPQGRETLANGVARLELVRDFLRQHLSDEVMKWCQ
jgi:hypothetical protein